MQIRLIGSDARAQLLVTERVANPAIAVPSGADLSSQRDVTRQVTFESVPNGIVEVDATGLVRPLQNGSAKLVAKDASGNTASMDVEVAQWADNPEVNFPNQVVPIFTKFGCNGGGCHGKAAGQNGFKLSCWASSLVKILSISSRNREDDVFHLLPRPKPFVDKSPQYGAAWRRAAIGKGFTRIRVLRRWIAQGMPYGNSDDATVKEIRMVPNHRRMQPRYYPTTLRRCCLHERTVQDVTRTVQFDSNDTDMAEVDKLGFVAVKQLAGEVAIMARYQGQVAVYEQACLCRKQSTSLVQFRLSKSQCGNSVDQAINEQLNALNIPTSGKADEPDLPSTCDA